MKIFPYNSVLGATIEGFDISKPISDVQLELIKHALACYGFLRFPKQKLEEQDMIMFASKFGSLEVNVANDNLRDPFPQVMTLSNIIKNGKKIGFSDAGQGWHTDMSYSNPIALANMLYGMKIPFRDGRPLGDTQFCDMALAYETLPSSIKKTVTQLSAEHDFNKFWEMMRTKPGSDRPPLTAAQRAKKPPVTHPIVLRHPISRRKVLYCNPGYATRILGLGDAESNELLDFLFEHQLNEEFMHSFKWSEKDVLFFDNIRTLHNAVPDYTPEEQRLMKRCQVIADDAFKVAKENQLAHPN